MNYCAKKYRKLKNILFRFLVTNNWSTHTFDYRWKNHKDEDFRPLFYNINAIYEKEVDMLNTYKTINKIPDVIVRLKEAYDLFISLKMSDEDLLTLVFDIQKRKYK
jgi:hypothetical protein